MIRRANVTPATRGSTVRLGTLSTALFLAILLGGPTLLSGPTGLAAQGNGTRNAHWYIGSYGNEILVWDEATETVVERIPTRHPIPTRLTLSKDRSRLYVLGPMAERIEIIDLETRESIDEFTLSSRRTRVWISGFNVHPSGDWAAMVIQERTKLVDRYEIGEPTIVRLDLNTHQVTDTIPWPDEEQREFANFRFSPDGALLYMFTDELIALDSEDFTEVDRWDISAPIQPGLGVMSLPFASSPYQEEDGIYTGLFRVTDPVQNRRIMGIATVDLQAHDVDFYALGPSERVDFRRSADGTKGYGLHSEIGHYEMWKFDLANRRVSDRIAFPGRPRMALMPSADGTRLFVYNAGSTIDVYDEATFEHLRTVTFDADMTTVVVMPDPD